MRHYIFSNPIIMSVSGLDSPRYLNARLSNDITLLAHEQSIQSAILTPQGKTEGFFTVIKSDESFYLYCTGGNLESVVAAFKRFIVADRVSVEVLSDFELLHIDCPTAEDCAAAGLPLPVAFLNCIQNKSMNIVRTNRIGATGVDVLYPRSIQTTVESILEHAQSTPLSVESYELLRMTHGSLSFPQELNDGYLFAESELVHAVSFSKGCYVGQEALEMLAARGKLPARIVQFSVNNIAALTPGSPVFEDPACSKRIGQILSVQLDPGTDRFFGFARVKTAAASNPSAYLQEDIRCTLMERTNPLLQT